MFPVRSTCTIMRESNYFEQLASRGMQVSLEMQPAQEPFLVHVNAHKLFRNVALSDN